MSVRNQKYEEDGVIYYRMERGGYRVMLAVTAIELEVSRDMVAKRLRSARHQLGYLTRGACR